MAIAYNDFKNLWWRPIDQKTKKHCYKLIMWQLQPPLHPKQYRPLLFHRKRECLLFTLFVNIFTRRSITVTENYKPILSHSHVVIEDVANSNCATGQNSHVNITMANDTARAKRVNSVYIVSNKNYKPRDFTYFQI